MKVALEGAMQVKEKPSSYFEVIYFFIFPGKAVKHFVKILERGKQDAFSERPYFRRLEPT